MVGNLAEQCVKLGFVYLDVFEFIGHRRILLAPHRRNRMPPKKATRQVKPVTNKELEHLAGEATVRPSKLTTEEIRKLGAGMLERVRKEKAT